MWWYLFPPLSCCTVGIDNQSNLLRISSGRPSSLCYYNAYIATMTKECRGRAHVFGEKNAPGNGHNTTRCVQLAAALTQKRKRKIAAFIPKNYNCCKMVSSYCGFPRTKEKKTCLSHTLFWLEKNHAAHCSSSHNEIAHFRSPRSFSAPVIWEYS